MRGIRAGVVAVLWAAVGLTGFVGCNGKPEPPKVEGKGPVITPGPSSTPAASQNGKSSAPGSDGLSARDRADGSDPSSSTAGNPSGSRTSSASNTPPRSEPSLPSPASPLPLRKLDLSYISEEFIGGVIIHPSQMMKSSVAVALHDLLAASGALNPGNLKDILETTEKTGIDPRHIDQACLLLHQKALDLLKERKPGQEDPAEAFPAALILRHGQPLDKAKLLNVLGQAGGAEERQLQGKTYLYKEEVKGGVFFADDRTLIVASEDVLKGMLAAHAAKQVDSPLLAQLRQTGGQDAIVVVHLTPLRKHAAALAKSLPGPALFLLGFVGKVDTLQFSLNVTEGESLAKLQLVCDNPQAVRELEEMLAGLMQQMKNVVSQAADRPGVKPDAPEMLLIQSLQGAVQKSGVNAMGKVITAIIPQPEILSQPEKFKPLITQLVAQARTAAERTQQANNIKQMLLAMHNYHDVYRSFPAADGPGFKDSPPAHAGKLSWRVHLLPYLDQQGLYEQFKLDEPWDSEHNKKLIPLMPPLFGSRQDGKTSYHIFVGPGTLFGTKKTEPGMLHILDGTSLTVAIVLAGDDKADFWTRPGGLVFDPEKNPIELLGNIGDTFWAGFFDGHIRALPKTLDPQKLKLLIQHADGMAVGLE